MDVVYENRFWPENHKNYDIGSVVVLREAPNGKPFRLAFHVIGGVKTKSGETLYYRRDTLLDFMYVSDSCRSGFWYIYIREKF